MNSENSDKKPTNFIRNIINEDLSSGKHKLVITRFPPEPNGYLHIGHAKSICLNFGTAVDYDGWCNLRFDDTNPAKEDVEYVESIKEDVHWLGFEWHGEVKYSSDYFEKYYEYAVELVTKGLAYVCFLINCKTIMACTMSPNADSFIIAIFMKTILLWHLL